MNWIRKAQIDVCKFRFDVFCESFLESSGKERLKMRTVIAKEKLVNGFKRGPTDRSIKWKKPFQSLREQYAHRLLARLQMWISGLFKYYLHPWLIGDAIRVQRNIRKYEGALTQEGRLKVFTEKASKWGSTFREENLLVINGFYWNKHFYLIYHVEGKWRKILPFILNQVISGWIEKDDTALLFLTSLIFLIFFI